MTMLMLMRYGRLRCDDGAGLGVGYRSVTRSPAICLTRGTFTVGQDMGLPCRDLSSVGNGILTHERCEVCNQFLPQLAEPRIPMRRA